MAMNFKCDKWNFCGVKINYFYNVSKCFKIYITFKQLSSLFCWAKKKKKKKKLFKNVFYATTEKHTQCLQCTFELKARQLNNSDWLDILEKY